MEQTFKQNKTSDFFANDKKNKWILFTVFALFNIGLSLLFRAPYAYPDEYGVFAAGNWMFGSVSWDYKPAMYYGYTFSPFVGILMQLFDGIRPVYIISLCIKALQLSLIPVLSYKLLHEVLENQDPRMKMFISSIASLYPSITLYAKYMSNETTLHLTLFICLYLIGKCAVSQRNDLIRIYSVLLGFFAAFAYATHGMGLSFIVAICFVIPVAHFFTKKRLVSYPLFIASLALFYFLDAIMKDLVTEAVYSVMENGAINTFSYSLNRLLTTFFEPGAIQSLVNIFLSRMLYIMASTFGMFPLALITMFVFVCHFVKARFTHKRLNSQDCALFVVTLFSFAIFLCGLSLSTLNSIQSAESLIGKSFFYGRYFEYMAFPLIMVCFHYIFIKEVPKKTLLTYSIIVMTFYLVLSLYLEISVIPILADNTINHFFILGVVPFLGNTNVYLSVDSEISMQFNLYVLWVFTVVVFFVIMYLIIVRNYRKTAIGILLCMFLYGTIYDLRTTVLTLSVANYNYFYSHMEPLREALDEYSDVYEQYPNLYVITNHLGAEESPESLIRGRSQLSFFNYSVAGVFRPHLLNEVPDPQITFQNAIIVSNEDIALDILSEYEGYENYVGYTKIYESPTAYIWIHGDDITAYYNSR